MFNQESPDAINSEQIESKKDNRDQSNNSRVLYFVCSRPRNAPHFRARVTQELGGAAKEARRCSRASRMPATATRRQRAALGYLGWLAAWRFRRLGTRRLGFEFGFFFAHANFA